MEHDGPRAYIDVPALMALPASWWTDQTGFKKLDLERVKKAGLVERKLSVFK